MTLRRKSNASLFDPERLPPPPRGHVWVEWVGEASPLDNPTVAYNMVTNKYSREQKRMIRALCRKRIARVNGHTRRLKPDGHGALPGLSKAWYWGNKTKHPPGHPQSFVQALPFRDADIVKSSSVGHEFIVHNERDGEAQDTIIGASGGVSAGVGIRLVPAGEYTSYEEYTRAMGIR